MDPAPPLQRSDEGQSEQLTFAAGEAMVAPPVPTPQVHPDGEVRAKVGAQ